MPSKYLAFAALVAITSLSTAHAQVISMTNGELALDGSNILDVGPVVYAYDLDSGSRTTTVGGVTFVGTNVYNGTGPNGDFTISGGGFDGTGGSGNPPGTALTTQPVAVLNNNGVYYLNTFNLNNLTVGTTYDLQLVIDAQSPDNRQVVFTDDTNALDSVSSNSVEAGVTGPAYINEVFTATATSEDFTVSGNGPNGKAQLSGFVLETPEPSTYALMLGGLAFLGFLVRRKLA